jgi:lysophospholipase L1-like esterase
VLEAGLRLAGFSRQAAPVVLRFGYPDPREIVDLFRPDPRLFWRFRPDSIFDAETPVAINSAGYRGPLPAEPHPENLLRVAVLGDSVAFGGRGDWTADLGRRLMERSDGRPVEVLNFGVPGYTVIQGERQYEDDVRRLQPDLVILAYGWNDHWLAQGGLADHRRSFPSPARARLALLLTRLRLVQALHALLPVPAGAAGTGEGKVDPSVAGLRVPPQIFKERLTALALQAREEGAVVVILGLPSGLFADDFPPYLVDMGFTVSPAAAVADHAAYLHLAARAADDAAVEFIDLQPIFAGPQGLPRRDLFSPDGIHPVPAGHLAIAAHLDVKLQAVPAGEASP